MRQNSRLARHFFVYLFNFFLKISKSCAGGKKAAWRKSLSCAREIRKKWPKTQTGLQLKCHIYHPWPNKFVSLIQVWCSITQHNIWQYGIVIYEYKNISIKLGWDPIWNVAEIEEKQRLYHLPTYKLFVQCKHLEKRHKLLLISEIKL